MTTRTFLVHGLLAGLLAGVAAFVVAYTVGEPHLDRAIALESAGATADHHHEDGATTSVSASHSHSHDDAAVSRTTQSTLGLATGTLAIGVVLGGLTGLLSAVGLGRLGSLRPAASTALVVLLGAVGSSLAANERSSFALGAITASALWFSAIGLGARRFASTLARPGVWRVIEALTGAVMLVLAMRRDRILATLTLFAGIGLAVSLPFALKAGAEFFLPTTAALVIAVALVPVQL